MTQKPLQVAGNGPPDDEKTPARPTPAKCRHGRFRAIGEACEFCEVDSLRARLQEVEARAEKAERERDEAERRANEDVLVHKRLVGCELRLDAALEVLDAARAEYRKAWDCEDTDGVVDLMREAVEEAQLQREFFKKRGGELDAAEEALKVAREALRKYGKHDGGCGYYRPEFPAHNTGPCTCGLTATLSTKGDANG